MRRLVPASRRVGLTREGKHVRLFPDTVDRLHDLAQIRRQTLAEAADEAICTALQAEWNLEDAQP